MCSTVEGFARMTAVITNIRFRTQAALCSITYGVTRAVFVSGAADNGHTPHTRIRIGNGVPGATTGVSTTGYVHTFSSSSTLAGSGSALIHIDAFRVRISRESRWAGTCKSSGTVCTRGILATASERSMHHIALIDVHTARSDIARVVGPSILAHTVGFILIRFAVGMGSTANILARLLARHSWRTTHISRLAFTAVRSGRIQALGMGTTHLGMGATLIDVHTTGSNRFESIQAEALILNALRIVGTIEVTAAQYIDIHLFAGHLGIGFAIISLRALAIVARNGIFAYRMLSTGLIQRGTLIDIHTSAERITGIVRFACAHEAANGVRADRILPTRIILTLVDVYAISSWCRDRGDG